MTTEETLRKILAAEAESVEVAPDALQAIRGRIARRRSRWWRSWRPQGLAMLTFTGGTAVVAAAAVALALVQAPKVKRVPQAPAGPPAVVQPAGPTANVPVYYLGDTGLGTRLFREYHVVPVDGTDVAARTRAAVQLMLTTDSPADPDYRTPWGNATVNSVWIEGDTVSVDLHDVPQSPVPDAQLAVQQLIWTATAASGTTGLRVTVDGHQVSRLWGFGGLDARLGRAPRADIQAPVWLIDPQQGAQVGTTFAVYVAAIVPGGTVQLTVTPVGGGQPLVVKSLPMGASAPQLGEVHLSVTVAPGRYTVSAFLAGPSGAPGPDRDSHEIAVG
jgi:Sporulation and spore germination